DAGPSTSAQKSAGLHDSVSCRLRFPGDTSPGTVPAHDLTGGPLAVSLVQEQGTVCAWMDGLIGWVESAQPTRGFAHPRWASQTRPPLQNSLSHRTSFGIALASRGLARLNRWTAAAIGCVGRELMPCSACGGFVVGSMLRSRRIFLLIAA